MTNRFGTYCPKINNTKKLLKCADNIILGLQISLHIHHHANHYYVRLPCFCTHHLLHSFYAKILCKFTHEYSFYVNQILCTASEYEQAFNLKYTMPIYIPPLSLYPPVHITSINIAILESDITIHNIYICVCISMCRYENTHLIGDPGLSRFIP